MSKEKKTKYPDGSAIPYNLQQPPIDKDIYPVRRKGDGKSKTTYRSLSDEQAIEMGLKVKRNKPKPESVKYSTGGPVSGMRRFYKGGKV